MKWLQEDREKTEARNEQATENYLMHIEDLSMQLGTTRVKLDGI